MNDFEPYPFPYAVIMLLTDERDRWTVTVFFPTQHPPIEFTADLAAAVA